jgi:hypothetical protein
MRLIALSILGLFACFPALAQDGPKLLPDPPPLLWKPVVGQPAPDVNCKKWIDVMVEAKGTVTASVSMQKTTSVSLKARKLFDLKDHVVIVHTFAFDDASAREKELPLVHDLLLANADRKLAAIGIANKTELEAARAQAKEMGLDYPIALEDLTKSDSPYVDLKAHAACWAFVVGRGGGLLWQGNPTVDEKGFLAAVKSALDLYPVARVERRLNDRLVKALGDYYGGRLSRADAAAQDELKAGQKVLDMQRVDDAKLLDKAVHDTQLAWLGKLTEASAQKDATTYAALERAAKIAFAKGDMQKDLDRLQNEAHKDGFFEARMLESRKYLSMLDDRPVLFPVRKESASDTFATKLEAFARATPNSTEETRTAKSLSDKYRESAR